MVSANLDTDEKNQNRKRHVQCIPRLHLNAVLTEVASTIRRAKAVLNTAETSYHGNGANIHECAYRIHSSSISHSDSSAGVLRWSTASVVSRPRSRVNSSMARLEEDVVFSPSATELGERNRGVSGASSGSGSGEAVSPMAGMTS